MRVMNDDTLHSRLLRSEALLGQAEPAPVATSIRRLPSLVQKPVDALLVGPGLLFTGGDNPPSFLRASLH
jgi:hypothetical protein